MWIGLKAATLGITLTTLDGRREEGEDQACPRMCSSPVLGTIELSDY